MNLARMEEQLILHEGLKLAPYLDSVGKWTAGVGYNITDRGLADLEHAIGRKVKMPDLRLTRDEALLVLRADVARIARVIPQHFPEYVGLDEVRQRVCLDLAFNLGFRALAFKNVIAAIKRRDWSTAARELWRSKWADQVGDGPGRHWDRADRLTKMLLTGQDFSV